jgi:hypothetical protein
VREEKRGGGGLTGDQRWLAGLVGGGLLMEQLRAEAMLKRQVHTSCSGRQGGSGRPNSSSGDLQKRKEEVRLGH